MKVFIGNDAKDAGISAGNAAAELIIEAIKQKGSANIILATGASQFETLTQLIKRTDIQWDKVTMFHLDEYIGLPLEHKASFRKYLTERFLDLVPPLKAANLINGETDAKEEAARLSKLIAAHPIDVGLVGIGENAHLAFNDPPADFDTEDPYIIIEALDEDCKKQQMNEGWFKSMSEVPTSAISMSVKQIMRAKHLICSVPDQRKAQAVKNTLEEPISNLHPASILRNHHDCRVFLDKSSASLLSHAPAHYQSGTETVK